MSVEVFQLRPDHKISRVIKGGWQLAGGHGSFDRGEAIADMTRFLDAGITTFDCADIYTGVEEMIGEFIHEIRRRRGRAEADRIQVHTKLVPDYGTLETCSPADLEAIVDRSLERLKVEQLDLVQFFWWDVTRGRPFEVMASLKDLQTKGKIAHLATTNWDTQIMDGFRTKGLDLISAQVQYSLLDERPKGRFANWCEGHDVGILCYGTLAGGFLTERWLGKPDPGYDFENRSLIKYRLIIDEFGGWDLFQDLLTALKTVGDRYKVPLSTIASRAILDQHQVAAVIIGARTARNLAETLTIFDVHLDEEDRSLIDAVLNRRVGPKGPVYGLEGDRAGKHGRIMKYNLNATAS